MQYHHFSIEERERIQELFWQKKSIRAIAKAIHRSPASVSRELKRNFPPEHRVYTPRLAHARALQKRTSRGRHDRLKNEHIRIYVTTHLKAGWSPEQIAGRIRIDLHETISHEAIYQYIYAQVRQDGLLRPGGQDLRAYLRRKRKRRLGKGFRATKRMRVLPGRSIDDRPDVITQRSRIGDWESDTIESCNHRPGINTLVDRKTGLALITRLGAKTSLVTTTAIITRLGVLPVYSITFDNGVENQGWKDIEAELNTQCFYAHPYSSWERGTNENTNGLIREYFPKKTDFTLLSDAEIAEVEYALNTRPRKRLNYLTPLEAFGVALAG